MQILTLEINKGPDIDDLDRPSNSTVSAEIRIGENVRPADFHFADALDAIMGQSDRLREHISNAIGDLVDHITLAMLITQIIIVLKAIMLRLEKGQILRAVEDLNGPDGRIVGQIMIEAPTWKHNLFGNRSYDNEDEFYKYYRKLVTRYFDGDDSDAQLFMLLHDRTPVIRHALAYGISTGAAHAQGILESARDIADDLPDDMAQFAPRLREAADTMSRLARFTHRIVRIYDILRNPNGIEIGTYWIEAPFYIPDPTLPADAWLDVIFNPEAKAADKVA